MKKILLGVGVSMMVATSAMAQDPHFTQYFASPLTLNPALTGLTQCDLRLAANYRTQWASVSSNPYITGTISYDMATMKGKLNNGDAIGVGVLGLFDRSGTGGLQNVSVGLSVAYHKAFGYEKQHTLSIGVQGVLVQKSIDFSKLKFEDQFDRATGGTPYNTSENIGNADLNYPDFNVGLMYSGRMSEHATMYAGLSFYHLTQPTETFLQDSHQIHMRSTGYLGGSFDMNENIVLYASAMFNAQASASEVLAGAAVGFVLNPGHDAEYAKNTILYLGSWYRYGDAIAPYVGFEFSKMKVGITYDLNVSGFAPATKSNGGYELSLIFNGCINKREFKPTYNFACPKF
ncbi:MAG: PorP/SprF family type IX secretion system membrane protein [Bacteroidetes bacterium]|jgi:type IX secretion system PorP/SprF family membrane protein|nr:PorP/SprF family type IX secretion system membrane protein [Bacteroidota bacterium]